ncbi:cytidine deaminase family protein [Streptosporangium sp. NPDC000396]|uniref:cytidine deaminase family protein n=1 Tax=Streptosporangium sp. NPDC000396 TaxID=3366185 RepID=UPI003692FC71
MSTPIPEIDHELIRAASDVAKRYCRGDNHTVAAAARAASGEIITGVNVYHFSGGPCAELVVIGAAAGRGIYDLVTMVAVGDGGRGVIPPCGRCRQMMLDYFPAIRVIVGSTESPRSRPITELLPETYVWAHQQSHTQ